MVATEVERLSSCKVKIQITMPADRIDKIRKEQEKVVQKEVQIQGFRKGNAPLHMVKNQFAGTIEKQSLDEGMQQAFEEGLKDAEIQPVGYPVVKSFDFDDDKNLKMEIEVETYPEIKLKKYKNFSFEKIIYEIDADDVSDNIEYIRKQKAIISPVEGEAVNGHYITFSVQELDTTGMPLIGKKYNDVRVQLGEGQFDPDLESQIIGIKPGEERIIEKVYPKSAGKELAGKVERFRITMQTVEEEELPELDEPFVQDLNLDLKSVEELKEKVRQELQNRWGQESEQQFYHQVVHELLQENPFDAPDTMVDNYLDRIVEDIKQREKNIDEENVRKHYRTDAIFNIKWIHLKDKIAKEEKIESTEEDFKQFLADLKDDETRKVYETNQELKRRVMNDIFEKKVFDFLVNNSKVKEKKQSIKKGKAFENV